MRRIRPVLDRPQERMLLGDGTLIRVDLWQTFLMLAP